MILKEPGNFKIHRLRVIYIYKADYNLLLSVKYRRLLAHADAIQATHRGQHGGRPGHEATTLTLLEELKNDISYAARRILLNFDNDVASCYDRIIVALASLVSRRFGQHAHVVWVNATTLEEARFRLKTALGVSDRFYSHCVAFPLHGTGQGSGNSPVIWCFISSVLFEAHEEQAHGATFTSPDGTHTVHFSMVGFVDDSTSQTNSFEADPQPSPAALSVLAQHDAQLWNDLLWSSGGLLELTKCSYHILSFQFHSSGRPHPRGGSLDTAITLHDSVSGRNVPILSKSAFAAHKTLGNYKAPAGNNRTQLNKLVEKGLNLAQLLATAPIDGKMAEWFYHTIIAPSIQYPLPQSFFSRQQLDSAASKFMPIIYAKSGFNRNTAHTVLQGPSSLAGSEFFPLWVLQGEGQVQHFLKFWRTQSDVSTMLRIDLAWCQAQAGVSFPILEHPDIDLPHLEARWLPSLRDFLHAIDGSFDLDETFVVPSQREGDQHLMDIFIGCGQFSRQEICELNYCQLYLRVLLLLDIVTLDGNSIERRILRGERSRHGSSKDLPAMQANPGIRQWILWRRALRLVGDLNGNLHQPLGCWLLPSSQLHCVWAAYADIRYPFLYLRTNNGSWVQMEKNSEGLYTNPVSVDQWHPTDTVIPTSVTPVDGNFSVVSVPPLDLDLPLPPTPMPETFEEYLSTLEPWEQELLSNVELEYGSFELLSRLQGAAKDSVWQAILVSDGAGKQKSMAFGLQLVDTTNTPLASCSGPAFGTESLHRAEAYGQLAGVLLVYHLINFCKLQDSTWHIKWCSDIAGLIKRLIDRTSYNDTYPNSTLAPDWDVIEEIHQVRSKILGQHTYAHVKGHQDGDCTQQSLSLEAQANIEADRLAGEYNLYHHTERRHVPRLPSTRAQLYLQGHCITSHYKSAIRQAATYPALKRRIEERYQWSRRTCSTLDWEVLSALCGRYRHRSTWSTKLVHDLLPTNSVRSRYDPSICPDCLKCGAANESFEHILRCPHPERLSWRNMFLDTLRSRCDSLETRESLKDALISCLHHFLHGNPIDPESFHPIVQPVIREQTTIGWFAFLRGHVSQQWARLQHEHLVASGIASNTSTGSLWIVNVLHSAWDELWNIWEIHNKELHGFDANEQELKKKEKLAFEIRYLHSRRPHVLTADRDKFFIRDLGTFLAQNHSTILSNWLTTYRPIIEDSEQAAQSSAVAHTRPLTSHFTVIHAATVTTAHRRFNPRLHFLHDHTRKKKRRTTTSVAVPITRFFSRVFPAISPPPPSVVDGSVLPPSRVIPGPPN